MAYTGGCIRVYGQHGETMGNVTSSEALSLRWAEVMNDPALHDLPYKIELNNYGKIEMSPASNRHGRLQILIGAELLRQLPDGIVINEAAILTDLGVRVPDVAWGSAAFRQTHGESTPYSAAPEICIEIVSPSNSDEEMRQKIKAYLAAGAQEVWLVSEEGAIRYFNRIAEQANTAFQISISLPPPIS